MVDKKIELFVLQRFLFNCEVSLSSLFRADQRKDCFPLPRESATVSLPVVDMDRLLCVHRCWNTGAVLDGPETVARSRC